MNVVLLVVDTLRLKDFGAKGEEIAPFLNKKANEEDSIFLENYYSNAPWTAPAHASIFTGDLPSEHGTTTQNPLFSSKNRLIDLLSSKGFYTKGISENDWVSRFSGFDRGFDEFKDYNTEDMGGEIWKEVWTRDFEFNGRLEKWSYFTKASLRSGDYISWISLFKHLKSKFQDLVDSSKPIFNPEDAKNVLSRGIDFLNSRTGDKFLFMNILPVHDPYTFGREQKSKFLPDLADEEAEKASKIPNIVNYYGGEVLEYGGVDIRESCYKASINYMDGLIEEFYNNCPEETVFVVIGDHGELFGEYELYEQPLLGHHLGTFKELIEVPCFIFSKSQKMKLELDKEQIYDHRDIVGIIDNLTYGDRNVGREETRSEYFGLENLQKYRMREMPEKAKKFAKRKSFSHIDQMFKYDLTSEGSYLWLSESKSESENLDLERLSGCIIEKMDLLYGHNFESDT